MGLGSRTSPVRGLGVQGFRDPFKESSPFIVRVGFRV